jgi:rubrerythrin
MYTIEDIRQIAIQIEQNGEQTYRSAARRSDHREMAKILEWLADEEHHHGKWFKSMSTNAKEIPGEYSEMAALGRSLLREMVEGKTFTLDGKRLDGAEDVIGILSQSLGFEEDTILFYDMLKSFMEDKQDVAQLERIVHEERGHVKVLQDLMDKLLKGVDVDLEGIPILK